VKKKLLFFILFLGISRLFAQADLTIEIKAPEPPKPLNFKDKGRPNLQKDIITLKNGNKISGFLESYSEGVYYIKIGVIEKPINENDILMINGQKLTETRKTNKASNSFTYKKISLKQLESWPKSFGNDDVRYYQGGVIHNWQRSGNSSREYLYPNARKLCFENETFVGKPALIEEMAFFNHKMYSFFDFFTENGNYQIIHANRGISGFSTRRVPGGGFRNCTFLQIKGDKLICAMTGANEYGSRLNNSLSPVHNNFLGSLHSPQSKVSVYSFDLANQAMLEGPIAICKPAIDINKREYLTRLSRVHPQLTAVKSGNAIMTIGEDGFFRYMVPQRPFIYLVKIIKKSDGSYKPEILKKANAPQDIYDIWWFGKFFKNRKECWVHAVMSGKRDRITGNGQLSLSLKFFDEENMRKEFQNELITIPTIGNEFTVNKNVLFFSDFDRNGTLELACFPRPTRVRHTSWLEGNAILIQEK
jgi:hypothetical protein